MSAAINLVARVLTIELFAPFGTMFDVSNLDSNPVKVYPCNQGRAHRYHDLAGVVDVADEGGRAGVSVYRATPSHLPFALEVVERHPLGSQLFLPLESIKGRYYVIAVADGNHFDIKNLQAFMVPAHIGIHYKKGIWHLPILALDHPMDFLAIDRIGEGNNCDEVHIKGACFIVAA